jgi:hypothetical protein
MMMKDLEITLCSVNINSQFSFVKLSSQRRMRIAAKPPGRLGTLADLNYWILSISRRHLLRAFRCLPRSIWKLTNLYSLDELAAHSLKIFSLAAHELELLDEENQ